jgi:hypothetical protein
VSILSVQENASLVIEPILKGVTLSSMACTNDHLLVAGDGFLAILDIGEKTLVKQSIYSHSPFDGTLLTSREALSNVDDEIVTIENRIVSLRAAHTTKLAVLKEDAQRKQNQLAAAHQAELDAIKAESSPLKEEINKCRAELAISIDEVKAQHDVKMSSAKNEADIRLSKERGNTATFQSRCEEMRRAFEIEMAEKEEQLGLAIERETRKFHGQMNFTNQQCEDIIESIDAMRNQSRLLEQELEDDFEREIAKLWIAHNEEMKNLKHTNQLLSNEVCFPLCVLRAYICNF